MTRILLIVIISFFITMMLTVGSFAVVYSQNSGNQASIGTRQSGAESKDSSLLNNLIIRHAGGELTSLQTDIDNITWIATGKWDLVSVPSGSAKSGSGIAQFNATIHTRRIDNSQGHDHKISNLNLVNSSVSSSGDGSIIVLNGTATIDTEVGLYPNVPISIKMMDTAPAILSISSQSNVIKSQWVPQGGTIALLIDERIQDHFGKLPVYGDIRKEK